MCRSEQINKKLINDIMMIYYHETKCSLQYVDRLFHGINFSENGGRLSPKTIQSQAKRRDIPHLHIVYINY